MIPANMTLEVSELFTRELTRVRDLILVFLSIACYTKGTTKWQWFPPLSSLA